MENQKANLFIVDDDKVLASNLKSFLQHKFGDDIQISCFYDGESCMKMINTNTSIVILDYNLNGRNGLEILKEIKEINPNTEVIMFSNNEDIAIAIQTFRAGAKDYVIKGTSDWKKITRIISEILLAPIHLLVRELKVSKFVAIFLVTFVTMLVIVLLTYKMVQS
jgi:DNA-binding NarL/FixJ family response regulator